MAETLNKHPGLCDRPCILDDYYKACNDNFLADPGLSYHQDVILKGVYRRAKENPCSGNCETGMTVRLISDGEDVSVDCPLVLEAEEATADFIGQYIRAQLRVDGIEITDN